MPKPKASLDALLEQFHDAIPDAAMEAIDTGEGGEAYRVLTSAVRLIRLIRLDAPRQILESERQLLLKKVGALPNYNPDGLQ